MPDGVKYDGEKIRLDLISPETMYGLGEVLTAGAIKYGERNWENGMDWTRIFGATMRHLWTWFARFDLDPELRLSHLKCALCNVSFLVTYEARKIGKDNRPDGSGLQDDGYYRRDRLVWRFNDVLDPFVFEARSPRCDIPGDVQDVCGGVRTVENSLVGARRFEE